MASVSEQLLLSSARGVIKDTGEGGGAGGGVGALAQRVGEAGASKVITRSQVERALFGTLDNDGAMLYRGEHDFLGLVQVFVKIADLIVKLLRVVIVSERVIEIIKKVVWR